MLLMIKCITITGMLKCEHMCIIESMKYVLASGAQVYKDPLCNQPPCIHIRSLWRAGEKKHGLLLGGSSKLMHVKMVHKFRIICEVSGLQSLLLLMLIFLSGAPTPGQG